MVKGVSRQVIVVKSPDPRLFEQAIFIVRDTHGCAGVSAEQILEEARRVANGYVRQKIGWRKRLRRFPQFTGIAIGAAAASLLWLCAVFLVGFL